MFFISLQSGSDGNSAYVESGGVRLVFDAGVSGRKARERLAPHGRQIDGADALIVSHDHADHVTCAGIFQRMFGVPLFMTERTLNAARAKYNLGRLDDVRRFTPGETLHFGHVSVETFRTPHDGAEGSAFVIDDGVSRLALLTDLGHVYARLRDAISSSDAVFLESNYDPHMLAAGPYPAPLKRRIAGPGGHLSNGEAAELLARSTTSRLRWICLAHLSGENNTPALALAAHREALGCGIALHVAPREGPSPLLEL